MRPLTRIAILAFVAALAAPSFVHAADEGVLPAGVFRMVDGTYYQPSSGKRSMALEDLAPGAVEPPPVTTRSTTEPTTTLPYVMPTPNDPFPLKGAITRGRELLEVEARALNAKVRTVSKEADARHVTVAIWDPATDAIRTASGLKQGVKFTPDDASGKSLRVTRSNGVNSEFDVRGSDEMVVAIRYPIYKDIGTGKVKKYQVEDVVYSPYSADLHTPEMIAYGKAWMDTRVEQVLADLRREGVPSRSLSSQRLADVIRPELVELVMAIEHIDHNAIKQDAVRQLERFYVILAANEDASYGFSRSPVGALGLVQFMPKTYAFVASMPRLDLIKDFETAMRTPANAIKAQVAYLDYILANLPKGTADRLATSPDLVHEYVAAAYNGGYARVKKAMAAWEENLDAKERLRVLSRSRLRIETMNYVLKLRLVRSMLRTGTIQIARAT